MAYFLVSVSNRTNLDLCMRYGLAGFTSSVNGLWTFVEIQEGDYVSFLYGARVFNLYKVMSKEALRGADKLPPWPSVTFRMSGKTYYFPFRLHLDPVRHLNEPMVRPEFSYVAENLLLRGGYRKTHFQADQITLHAVSQMGELSNHPSEPLKLDSYQTFQPKLTWNKSLESSPEVFHFQELILQSLIRHYLCDVHELQGFFLSIGLNNLEASDFEALGEKALSEGHVDILLKDTQPVGTSRKIIVEVKARAAGIEDIMQLRDYMHELGAECIAGVLVARRYSKGISQKARDEGILPLIYLFEGTNAQDAHLFEELKRNLRLEVTEYDRSRG
jgi:hypothetical protein